jgi:hypothetical protein
LRPLPTAFSLCLLFLSEDDVPIVLVGTGDRLLFFAPAVVGRRFPLRLGGPLARGARCLWSGLAFRRARCLWSGLPFLRSGFA